MLQLLICAGLCWWVANVVYSLLLSPLRGIPGPLVFQVFPLLEKFHRLKGDYPFVLNAYFRRYGPVFRMGWRQVMFVDPAAAAEIYAGYNFAKSHEYGMFEYYGANVISARDRDQHGLRRRRLAPAFSKRSVREMEPTVVQAGVLPLLANLAAAAGSGAVIDIFHQFHYLSWDIVIELVYGRPFGLLKGSANQCVVRWMDRTFLHGILTTAVPFLKGSRFASGERLREVLATNQLTFSSCTACSKHRTQPSSSSAWGGRR